MRPMLAKKWNDSINPTGWYMSEKLDGVRAIWDGSRFLSRNEKDLMAPEWFIKDIPKCLLDGELWLGRGRFNEVSGRVRRKYNINWDGIKYMVFDIPKEGDTFKFRYSLLKHIKFPSHVYIINQVKCINEAHLLDFELMTIEEGGEGVMLHHPDSIYKHGKRSNSLLKLKRFNDDEAIVCNYVKGKGKYINMVGALLCKYNNTLITVGTGLSDADRINPPPIGSTITFKYFEMSNNIPRFPVFVGERFDLKEKLI